MNNILVLTNMYPSPASPQYGIFVKKFTDSLEKFGMEYTLISMKKENSKIKKAISYFLFFLKTFFVCLFSEYDAVYIHYASITSIPVILASRFKKMNIFTNVHGTDAMPVTKVEKKLEKNTEKICKLSSQIIVPSNYFKEMIIEKYKINKNKIIVYPSSGVDPEVFYPISDIQPRTKLRIGFVSRIEEMKGWETFLKAIKQLIEENRFSFDVILIGNGKDEEKLKKNIKTNDLLQVVQLMNSVNQEKLNKYFNEMDLFVFPTMKESLGLVALESMSAGTPVLASNIPPMNEYIEDRKNGILFEQNNYQDLAKKINMYFSLSEKEKQKITMEAYNTAEKYHTNNLNESFKQIFNIN